MENGWDSSAAAWIDDLQGIDFGRRFVLDTPMLARLDGLNVRRALDVGCGEGRFCRMMQQRGIKTAGIDPTEALLHHARTQDPHADYRTGRAE